MLEEAAFPEDTLSSPTREISDVESETGSSSSTSLVCRRFGLGSGPGWWALPT